MFDMAMNDQASSLLARLRSLKDEIRLQIHLCGMKLRATLCDLELQIAEVEQQVMHASSEALKKLQEVTERLEIIVGRLLVG